MTYNHPSLDQKLRLARAWVEQRRIWSPKVFRAWLASLRRLDARP